MSPHIGRIKPGSRRRSTYISPEELHEASVMVGDRPSRPDAMSMTCASCEADTLIVGVDTVSADTKVTMMCTTCGHVERI